jgi:hypothetical protein
LAKGDEAEQAAQSAAYTVRNTFIEIEDAIMADSRQRERDILSCPAIRVGMMSLPLTLLESSAVLETSTTLTSAGLRFEVSSTAQPLIGSLEVPTVGSIGHGTTCKPCAFYHKQGCANGVNCEFCHLCGPGEKRRRHKEKKAQMQHMKMQQHAAEEVVIETTTAAQTAEKWQPVDQVIGNHACPSAPSSARCENSFPHVPYGVRNTFIDTCTMDANWLPQDREVSSCPANKVGRMGLPRPLSIDFEEDPDAAGNALVPDATPQRWPVTPLERWPETLPSTPINHMSWETDDDAMMRLESLGFATALAVLLPPEDNLMQPLDPVWQNMMSQTDGIMAAPGPVLRLVDAIPEPVLGSSTMPTVGSVNHHMGTCKPCSFLHKQGCENGVNCTFCHLCDPGEKKRRQKLKKMQLQSMKQQQEEQAGLTSIGNAHVYS